MTDDLARTPRLIIPGTSPLSLLCMAGADALNYLFVPNVALWITDMVEIEATRTPDADDDRRANQRKVLTGWLADNSHRIAIIETRTGSEYKKAMTSWEIGGSQPGLKPSWRGRGDYSLLDILAIADSVVEDNEAVVMLVDDRRARAALRQTEGLNLDILSTRSFVSMLETDFGVTNASDIWRIIEIAAGTNEHGKSRVPDQQLEDPIHVRKP